MYRNWQSLILPLVLRLYPTYTDILPWKCLTTGYIYTGYTYKALRNIGIAISMHRGHCILLRAGSWHSLVTWRNLCVPIHRFLFHLRHNSLSFFAAIYTLNWAAFCATISIKHTGCTLFAWKLFVTCCSLGLEILIIDSNTKWAEANTCTCIKNMQE